MLKTAILYNPRRSSNPIPHSSSSPPKTPPLIRFRLTAPAPASSSNQKQSTYQKMESPSIELFTSNSHPLENQICPPPFPSKKGVSPQPKSRHHTSKGRMYQDPASVPRPHKCFREPVLVMSPAWFCETCEFCIRCSGLLLGLQYRRKMVSHSVMNWGFINPTKWVEALGVELDRCFWELRISCVGCTYHQYT